MKNKPSVRVIAFYLPQYHPITENNLWWGPGFTEWTNVSKSRPLFRGHLQPNLPGELGFYDLRLEETRIEQARLATQYGIEGFCYWHYWLGNGRRLLEKPFNDVLSSGKPNYPFCLGWANHPWTGVWFGSDEVLAEQNYPGIEDYEMHFDFLISAFKDNRYITVNNKPLFYIYRPKDIPDCKKVLDYWRLLAKQAGLDGLHFVGENLSIEELEEYGFDACSYSRHRIIESHYPQNKYARKVYLKAQLLRRKPKVYDYAKAMTYFIKDSTPHPNEYPSIVPNWDSTPRLGKNGVVLKGSSPELFRKHIQEVFSKVKKIDKENRIVFAKSWNEWAEGNYLEPDRRHKRKYLEVLKDELTSIKY